MNKLEKHDLNIFEISPTENGGLFYKRICRIREFINCNDSLPKDCDVVLLYLECRKYLVGYLMYSREKIPIIYVNDNNSDDYYSLHEVTHWAELPEEPTS